MKTVILAACALRKRKRVKKRELQSTSEDQKTPEISADD